MEGYRRGSQHVYDGDGWGQLERDIGGFVNCVNNTWPLTMIFGPLPFLYSMRIGSIDTSECIFFIFSNCRPKAIFFKTQSRARTQRKTLILDTNVESYPLSYEETNRLLITTSKSTFNDNKKSLTNYTGSSNHNISPNCSTGSHRRKTNSKNTKLSRFHRFRCKCLRRCRILMTWMVLQTRLLSHTVPPWLLYILPHYRRPLRLDRRSANHLLVRIGSIPIIAIN